nr:hypothetical protein [Enterovibrio nigricans]
MKPITILIKVLMVVVGVSCTNAMATNFNYTNLEIGFTADPSGLAGTGRFTFMDGATLSSMAAVSLKVTGSFPAARFSSSHQRVCRPPW